MRIDPTVASILEHNIEDPACHAHTVAWLEHARPLRAADHPAVGIDGHPPRSDALSTAPSNVTVVTPGVAPDGSKVRSRLSSASKRATVIVGLSVKCATTTAPPSGVPAT
jgi:hypothetical protein